MIKFIHQPKRNLRYFFFSFVQMYHNFDNPQLILNKIILHLSIIYFYKLYYGIKKLFLDFFIL